MKKKVVMFFLVLIGLCAAAVSAQTEADFEVDLTADGAGVMIKKYVGTALQVRIPATIQGMPVKEIGQYAFSDEGFGRYVYRGNIPVSVIYRSGRPQQGITSIVVPEGVTKIGEGAFGGWGPNADGTGSLISITLPDSVTEIGNSAFINQVALTAVTLPKSLSRVGSSLFENCTALKTVTIPEGVRVISGSMFSGCTALAGITIPNSVTSIGAGAFSGSGLTSISWPASIPAIPRGIFGSCTKLTSVVLPEGVQSIGTIAFQGCTALTSITLPSTILEIQEGAFNRCAALTTVTIPETVKAIYFSGLEGRGGSDSDKDGGLNTGSCPKLNLATQAALRRVGSGSRILVIANGVTEINERAYANRELVAVILPPSVTTIGARVFERNYMTSVTIGANVSIGVSSGWRTFEFGFDDFYNNNGKKAGVYKYDNDSRTWLYTE
jgi:hypothetical protein